MTRLTELTLQRGSRSGRRGEVDVASLDLWEAARGEPKDMLAEISNVGRGGERLPSSPPFTSPADQAGSIIACASKGKSRARAQVRSTTLVCLHFLQDPTPTSSHPPREPPSFSSSTRLGKPPSCASCVFLYDANLVLWLLFEPPPTGCPKQHDATLLSPRVHPSRRCLCPGPQCTLGPEQEL